MNSNKNDTSDGLPKGEYSEVEISAEECGELRQQRQAGVSYETILQSYDTQAEYKSVLEHITGACECETDVSPVDEKPYAEKQFMNFLYFTQDLDFTEIGFICGCHRETIKTWICERHDLAIVEDDERTSSKRIRRLQRWARENGDDSSEEEEQYIDRNWNSA